MPAKPPQKPKSKPKSKRKSKSSAAKRPGPRASTQAGLVDEIVARLHREVEERLGPHATFEDRQNAAFDIMKTVLWKKSDDDLQGSVADAEEVEVGGKRFRRMEQASSATYVGRWGSHIVHEPLYREVGVRNGPTIKPVELRVGIIQRMTPDMACVVGALSAERGSRGLERTLRLVGLEPPSRAFLADRTTQMGSEIAGAAAALEHAAREVEAMPAGVASASCGIDRMAVRMGEPCDEESPPPLRTKPYERTPPPPMVHRYRKAWVGSTTVYDAQGKELHTWRIAAEATVDPAKLADRVAADVAWILGAHPEVPVHCIQDAAPELRALPEALKRALPMDAEVVELVDFEHLMGYLDDVVDACDPGDPHDMKSWYRSELLNHDDAIDRILRNLRDQATRLRGHGTAERNAVAAAISYIRKRRKKMRYASHYRVNLPIGSGATESTCWQMQQRVKLPGQSWETGLGGVLAVRGLVLSERWDIAWPSYAAGHRMEVHAAA